MAIKHFSEKVSSRIGNYVYRLIDPRNGETFYVGKGSGDRVFYHADDANVSVDYEEENDIPLKFNRIKEIHRAGLDVIHVIHRHDIPDDAVNEVEAALIDAYPGLTNAQGGHGSSAKGPMSAKEIVSKYALPAIDSEPEERLILININRLDDQRTRTAILKQTQVAWRISLQKAKQADFILSVVRGVVVGAFVAEAWLPATHDNFPDLIPVGSEMPDRNGFKGKEAPEEIWGKFVGENGKRIEVPNMKHVQNPIRYWNI